MKVILNKKILIKHLELSNSVCNSNFKINSPIVKNVLIVFKKSKAFFKTISNNSLRCVSKIDDVSLKNDFEFLINPKIILDIILKSSDEEICIEKFEENVLKISYYGYETNINLIDHQDFPDFKINDFLSGQKINITKKDVDFIINKIIFNYPSENNFHQQIYDSVQIDSQSLENQILFSFTNSIQLSNFKREYYGFKFKFCIQKDVFKNLLFLLKIDENILFYFFEEKLYVKNNFSLIEIKNWEEIIGLNKFGDVTKILRDKSLGKVIISKKKLTNALEKSIIFKKENLKIIKIIINNFNLIIKSRSDEIGNSTEILDIKTKNINKEFEINIDANYFLSAIKFFENDEIEIGLGGVFSDVKTDPIIITEKNIKNYVQIIALTVS